MGEMTKTSVKYCRKCKYSLMLIKNTLIRNGVSIALVGSEDTGKDDGCIMFFDTAEYCRTGKFKGISVKTIDLVR